MENTQQTIEQLTKENAKLKKAVAFYQELCPDVFTCKTCDELVSADDDLETYVCESCNQPFHGSCDPAVVICEKHQLNKDRNCEHLTPCPDCPPGTVQFYNRCKSHFNPAPEDQAPDYCRKHAIERLNGTRGPTVPMRLSTCCRILDWHLCKSCFENPEPVVKIAMIRPVQLGYTGPTAEIPTLPILQV